MEGEPSPVFDFNHPEKSGSVEDFNDIKLPDEITENETTQEELRRRSLIEKITDLSVQFIRNPGKKILSYLGAMAVIGGMGYLKRDEIIDTGFQFLCNNPVVTKFVDRAVAAPFTVRTDQTVSEGVNLKSEKTEQYREDVVLNFKDDKIHLIESFYFTDESRQYDHGPELPVTDEYLVNLIKPDIHYVQPPIDREAFDQFLLKNVEHYLRSEYGHSDDRQEFTKGSVEAFLRLTNTIVKDNIKYDERTESWLKTTPEGRLSLKWGESNPWTAYQSSNDEPIDTLMMKEHKGVCRHYAEAMTLVSEELKKLFPDRFQNIHIIPVTNGYKWHEYNAVIVIRGPHDVDMSIIEPQTGVLNAPTFDLLKILYDREIISQPEFYKNITKMINVDQRPDLDNYDNIISLSGFENHPEIAELARQKLLHAHTGRAFGYLARKGLITHEEFLLACQEVVHSEAISGMFIEEHLGFAKTIGGESLQAKTLELIKSVAVNKPNLMPGELFNLYDYKQLQLPELSQLLSRTLTQKEVHFNFNDLEKMIQIFDQTNNINGKELLTRNIIDSFNNYTFMERELRVFSRPRKESIKEVTDIFEHDFNAYRNIIDQLEKSTGIHAKVIIESNFQTEIHRLRTIQIKPVD